MAQVLCVPFERDMPQLGIRASADLAPFLDHAGPRTCAGLERPARAFGIAATTVRHYLDILTSALAVRQLPPWFGNVGKRQIKAPKVYISDSGVLHTLLNLPTHDDLEGHPKVGASWEGFVVNEIITRLGARPGGVFLGHAWRRGT